jgi:uncharacterized protein (TIGR02466 family)
MNQEILLGKIPLLISDWEDFRLYKEKIINVCLQLEKQNTVESNISVQTKKNLWESDFDFLEVTNELIDLKLWLIKESESMINKINNNNYKVAITESWAHVTRPNGYHIPHYHNNSTWSGIFYVDSDTEEQGNNWYLPYFIERKPGLDFAEDRFSSKFVPGRLILFPSMLMHDAEPYQGKNARILIGFNAICL